MKMQDRRSNTTRREFLRGTASGVAAFTIVPGFVLGRDGRQTPSNKLNLAFVGAGGRARANLGGTKTENIVALCDVDEKRAAESYKKMPKVKKFRDFRKMLDEMEKDIDAVVVSTPDHTHAVALMRAIKMGKHVYSEKPLAHSLAEVRALRKAAQEHKVATQLGNQGHSFDSIRLFCEWIWDGAIGKVRRVHCLCNTSWGRYEKLPKVKERHPVPKSLDWDLWLGPAQFRPYNPAYCPGSWRGWTPFGTGALGDWTCHIIDPVFWALKLGAPKTIRAQVFEYNPKTQADTFAKAPIIHFEFPARGDLPPVLLSWYGGGKKPPWPRGLEKGRKLPGMGALVFGERAGIMYGSHGAGDCRIFPERAMKAYPLPEKSIPRSPGHHQEWLRACKGGEPAGSNFEYGGPLTEIALLGVIAQKFNDRKLEWDGEKFTNCPEANSYLNPPYRDGWTL